MLKKKLYIIVILLALVILSLSFLMTVLVGQYSLKEDMYFKVQFNTFEYTKGTNIKIGDNGMVALGELNAESRPLYSKDSRKILLTNDYLYYYPVLNQKFQVKKIPLFTEIFSENKTMTFKKGLENKEGQKGFLYDGDDTYIFLEAGKIKFKDKEINLGVYSYAVAEMGEYVTIYNTASSECKRYDDPIEVIFETNDYKVNLTTDTYKFGSKEVFMISNKEICKNYFDNGD